MKPYIVFILLALLCCSCDKTRSEMRIIINNETNVELKVQLFPNDEYLNTGGYSYWFSAIGSGSRPNELVLGIDGGQVWPKDEVLYYTDDLSISAANLVKQVFDSVHITFSDEQESIIRFTHSAVSGYAKNLFTDEGAWTYELENYDDPVGLSITHVEANEYTFTFKEENIEQ